MKKIIVLGVVVGLLGIAAAITTKYPVGAGILEYFRDDPDMPTRFREIKDRIGKEEFMARRAEGIAMKRGLIGEETVDPNLRIQAVRQLERQEAVRSESLNAAWTEIGPNPIPNAQVETGPQTTASGRTISIAVHPTNPDLVYVGTAQGGLYRSSNGGTNWTRLMDSALSLAVGAIAIAPTQLDTIYVGTGEPNFSGDSFFGVGVYRIDNASTANPTLVGPLGSAEFTGRAISEIIVHPTDPATIFVSSTAGVGGSGGAANNVLASRGIYRSTNATSGSPTFTRIGTTVNSGNSNVRDIVIDPLNPNLLVAHVVFAVNPASNLSGIYVSTDALAANPTFTQRLSFTSTSTSELTGELAVQHSVGAPNPTFYAAVGNSSGGVYINTDGGTTWTLRNSVNFCSPQCFYDIAIDVDPTDPAKVYLGGSPSLVFGRSTNDGTNFTTDGANFTAGLHVDTQAIAVAPSNPQIVYFASDGGIYRTTDVSATPIVWTSLNNSEFTATQFTGLAVHPTDPNFTIGGTQDNGTNFYRSDGTWTRADFGDGGFAAIDQNAVNTTNVTMYHTYFNQTNNLVGFARVSSTACATEGNWAFKGFGAGVFSNACGDIEGTNGILGTQAVLFYAPLELGPGNPNTVYFGTTQLYRSINRGDLMTPVSQALTNPISAIGVSRQNDNVRVVGTSGGEIFGTTTGANPLINLDPGNAIPNGYVGKVTIDPTNANTAYVTLGGFGIVPVWKTLDLNSATPTWTAVSTGLPQVPVNAFTVDPVNANVLYAGTDIGVYTSHNSGATWAPFGTGLPRVAVFDMEITAGRMLRIATHGRGLWQIALPVTTAADLSISGRVLTAQGRGLTNAQVTVTAPTGESISVLTGRRGSFLLDGLTAGKTYILTVGSRRFYYEPRPLTLSESVTNMDIYPAQAGTVVRNRGTAARR